MEEDGIPKAKFKELLDKVHKELKNFQDGSENSFEEIKVFVRNIIN